MISYAATFAQCGNFGAGRPADASANAGRGFPLALRQEILYLRRIETCRSERGADDGHDENACRTRGEHMRDGRIDLPQGTLDLLILRTLALGPEHGWAISERIHQISSKVLQVQQGSLYPALHRLERRGWIKAHWGASENNRRAKYYELTKKGRKQLETEESEWKKLAAAIAQVLETA